jgi:hypothetical protein
MILVDVLHVVVPLSAFILVLILQEVVLSRKLWIVALPILAASLFLFRGEISVTGVQIAMLAVWLLLLGEVKIVGFSKLQHPLPRRLYIAVSTVGIAASLVLCSIFGWRTENNGGLLSIPGVLPLLLAILFTALIMLFLIELVFPLFVRNTTERQEELSDYGIISRKKTHYAHIRFTNDPNMYVVSRFCLRRLRGKLGSVYSYVQCDCLFGVTCIKQLKLVNEREACKSAWERSLHNPRTSKEAKFAIVFVLCALLFCGLVVAFIFFANK